MFTWRDRFAFLHYFFLPFEKVMRQPDVGLQCQRCARFLAGEVMDAGSSPA
jgi:hypothetical protein